MSINFIWRKFTVAIGLVKRVFSDVTHPSVCRTCINTFLIKLNSRFRNKLNHVIRIGKKSYYFDKFQQNRNDMKGTWKIVNELLNNNNNVNLPDTFKIGDNTVSDKQEIANSVNDYFVNLGPSLAAKIHSATLPSGYLSDPNPSSFSFSSNSGRG